MLVATDQVRTFTTGGGTMTTLASPTLGGSRDISLWRVEMSAGQAGPLHRIDGEQIWTLQAGAADLSVDGETTRLHAGDTIVVGADATRRIAAVTDVHFLVAGSPRARAFAEGGPADGVVPPWTA